MLIAEADVAPEPLPGDEDLASMEDLLEFEAGPAMISYLSCIDVEQLDDSSASVVLQLWERQQAWVAERVVTVTARLAGPTPPPTTESIDALGRDGLDLDAGVFLVEATLGMTTNGAQSRVEVARAITEKLPACRLAMAAGFMSYRQTQIVADAVTAAGLGQLAVAAVDARVASKVKGQSWVAFRRTLRAAVLAADPDLVLAEHAAAMKFRAVHKIDLFDQVMTQLQFTMSSIDAQTVWLGLDATATQLQAAARAAGLVDEGIDVYRSEALVAWANHALGDSDAPRRHGRRQQVQYVIDLTLPARAGRQARRPARLRSDPRRSGARQGRSCGLASAGGRPDRRAPTRLRQPHLPTTGGVGRLPDRP